jgi:hypothetical protein
MVNETPTQKNGSKTFMDRIDDGEAVIPVFEVGLAVTQKAVAATQEAVSAVANNISGLSGALQDINLNIGSLSDALQDINLMVSALPFTAMCAAATTENIDDLAAALVPAGTIDGYTLSAGDIVLVKDQTNGWENGIYIVPDAEGTLTRLTGYLVNPTLVGKLTVVRYGTTNVTKMYQCTAYDETETTGDIVFVKMNLAAATPG